MCSIDDGEIGAGDSGGDVSEGDASEGLTGCGSVAYDAGCKTASAMNLARIEYVFFWTTGFEDGSFSWIEVLGGLSSESRSRYFSLDAGASVLLLAAKILVVLCLTPVIICKIREWENFVNVR